MDILMWVGAIIAALCLVGSMEVKEFASGKYEYTVWFSFDKLIPALLLAACAVGIFN